MSRFLLFDSGCSTCSDLASGVARESGGLVAARSLRDPQMQELLHAGRPGWSWEPTLIETEEDVIRVFTGFALRARMLSVLGPRRAWRVAALVARRQTPLFPVNESRRGLLKHGATLAAGAVGLALLGPSPSRVAAQFEAEGLRRPGRLSRGESIESWTVDRTANGFRVDFEHENRGRSGVVRVVYDNGDGSMSVYHAVSEARSIAQLGPIFSMRGGHSRCQPAMY